MTEDENHIRDRLLANRYFLHALQKGSRATQEDLIKSGSDRQRRTLSLVLSLIRDGRIPILKAAVDGLGAEKLEALHNWSDSLDASALISFAGNYNLLLSPLFHRK